MIEMGKHALNGAKTIAMVIARTPVIAMAIAETTGQITKATVYASVELAASRLVITVVAVEAISAMLIVSAKAIAATMTTIPNYRSEAAINTLDLICQ